MTMERAIANLLRIGVVLAAAIVLIAGIRLIALHGGVPPDYKVFRGEPASVRSLTDILGGAANGDARSQAQFGVLLLIATPVARVAFAFFAFAARRDWPYVAITCIILTILIYSLAASGA